jgi:hypothetical protein
MAALNWLAKVDNVEMCPQIRTYLKIRGGRFMTRKPLSGD